MPKTRDEIRREECSDGSRMGTFGKDLFYDQSEVDEIKQGYRDQIEAGIKCLNQRNKDFDLLRKELKSKIKPYCTPMDWIDYVEDDIDEVFSAHGLVDRDMRCNRQRITGTKGSDTCHEGLIPSKPDKSYCRKCGKRTIHNTYCDDCFDEYLETRFKED